MKMRLLMENWSSYVAETEGATKEEELYEGMGMAEKALHAGVLAAWLAGAADAAAHGDPTAPVAHVLDAMYKIAKDMPPEEEINAATFAKHLGKKLVGMDSEEEED
jgi:hypothetical protein